MGKKGKLIHLRTIWIVPVIVLLALVLVVSSTNEGFTKDRVEAAPANTSKDNYAIFPIVIPDSLDFAGEIVPLEYNDVREALDRELLSNVYFHSQTIRLIKMANRYFPEIESILSEQGIPDDFKYLAMAESGLANVVSPAAATGFWQIRKGTGNDYGLEINGEVDERYHLAKSTVVACKYIQESYEKYGEWTMAAASYNVGRRGIDRQVERQKQDSYYDLLLNEETARYLFRILAFKLILNDPAAYGFNISEADLYPPLPYKTVNIDGPVENFANFAIENGINYKQLKVFNPWLRENYLTNSRSKSYEIRIPLER